MTACGMTVWLEVTEPPQPVTRATSANAGSRLRRAVGMEGEEATGRKMGGEAALACS
jgi:hypothetical protein